jgi:hypothetical protein
VYASPDGQGDQAPDPAAVEAAQAVYRARLQMVHAWKDLLASLTGLPVPECPADLAALQGQAAEKARQATQDALQGFAAGPEARKLAAVRNVAQAARQALAKAQVDAEASRERWRAALADGNEAEVGKTWGQVARAEAAPERVLGELAAPLAAAQDAADRARTAALKTHLERLRDEGVAEVREARLRAARALVEHVGPCFLAEAVVVEAVAELRRQVPRQPV